VIQFNRRIDEAENIKGRTYLRTAIPHRLCNYVCCD